MKLLFYISHDGFIRNFEPVLHELDRRGHIVHLAVGGRRRLLMSRASSLEDLCEQLPGLSFSPSPKARKEDLARSGELLTTCRDYLRFLAPEYRDATKLRERAAAYAPDRLRRIERLPAPLRSVAAGVLDRVLSAAESYLPASAEHRAYMEEHRPDAVLLTPLIGFRSRQYAPVRTARALGIPTALLVHSWDNLTNKGVLHETPDRVMVWNYAQREEAIRLHRVSRDATVVTGAHSYDNWFSGNDAEPRADFCARIGLDPERRFLLYTCSSSFIAPDEISFVQRWLRRLRESPLSELGVVVRPHPQNLDQWRDARIDEPGRTVVWPPSDAVLTGPGARADYAGSIRHCSALVGINTSALVEGALERKPILSVLAPEFKETQAGTLHFGHLASSDNGLLVLAEDLDEHMDRLAESLDDPDAARDRAERFLRSFVRPFGLAEAGAPRVADALEDMAGVTSPRARRLGGALGSRVLRSAIGAAGIEPDAQPAVAR